MRVSRESERSKMAVHDKSQIRVNWYSLKQGGEMACQTRKKVYGVREELGKAVDEKIDAKCEHIVKPITLVLRTKGERATRMYEDRIQKILNEAVPEEPKKTSHVKLTRTSRLTHPDGTVKEVTETYEGPPEGCPWGENHKRQKTDGNAIDS